MELVPGFGFRAMERGIEVPRRVLGHVIGEPRFNKGGHFVHSYSRTEDGMGSISGISKDLTA